MLAAVSGHRLESLFTVALAIRLGHAEALGLQWVLHCSPESGRVKGNHQQPSFSRHVSMYLARHVGGWSYPKISRFYNDRLHTAVIAAIRKIELLRAQDESASALLDMLTALLMPEADLRQAELVRCTWQSLIVDAVGRRLLTAIPARTIE